MTYYCAEFLHLDKWSHLKRVSRDLTPHFHHLACKLDMWALPFHTLLPLDFMKYSWPSGSPSTNHVNWSLPCFFFFDFSQHIMSSHPCAFSLEQACQQAGLVPWNGLMNGPCFIYTNMLSCYILLRQKSIICFFKLVLLSIRNVDYYCLW